MRETLLAVGTSEEEVNLSLKELLNSSDVPKLLTCKSWILPYREYYQRYLHLPKAHL